MTTDIDANARKEVITAYFRKINTRDHTVLDLFTDDVQMFFPKFGLAHGKISLVKFAEIMTNYLEHIEHDVEEFNYIISDDSVVVEGTERGVTRQGIRRPDGLISQGRFCSVFEFDGTLI
jgi:ketosteroid isomerase-like protein